MTEFWLLAPVVVPLVGVALAAVAAQLRSRRLEATLVVFACAAALAAALGLLAHVMAHGPVAVAIGSWPAPFGIIMVADHLAAVMVAVCAVVATAAAWFAASDGPLRGIDRPGAGAPWLAVVAGVHGAFLTGDLFNLYVWFEVFLLGSFVLFIHTGDRGVLRGALKYVLLSLVSSMVFLMAAGLSYGATGTLNFAALAAALPQTSAAVQVGLLGLLLSSFAIKAAAFPLFAWLPASYHHAPPAVAALFAGLLTKVGLYALVRCFTLLSGSGAAGWSDALAVLAGATMIVGVLGAAAGDDVRRVLSFHIISQIGYMLMGLAIGTPLALAATVFYTVHHIVVKANLFLCAGAMRQSGGSFALAELGGLYRQRPGLALLFAVPAASLAGIPPLSGFWAKLALIAAGIAAEAWVLVAIATAVGILTLFSMTKVWAAAFWSEPETGTTATTTSPVAVGLAAPIAILAAITVAIGLVAQPLFTIAERAGAELHDGRAYRAAVSTAIGGDLRARDHTSSAPRSGALSAPTGERGVAP